MSEFINNIAGQSKFIPRAILLAIPLILSFLYISERRSRTKNKVCGFHNKGWLTVFMLYLAFILVSTIFSRKIVDPYRKVWSDFGLRTGDKWNYEAINNILLFIPYTFFSLQAFAPNKKHIWFSIRLSTITSSIIEMVQMLFSLGNFQFSDFLYNTLGGIVGCLLWLLFRIIIKKVFCVDH